MAPESPHQSQSLPWVVIGLGGSLIMPGEPATDYVQSFFKIIEKHKDKYRFMIIVGGGKTARWYGSALKTITQDSDLLDWVGIRATHINAEFVRAIGITRGWNIPRIFVKPVIVGSDGVVVDNIMVGGGWKPGWSTDYVAMQFGLLNNVKQIFCLSNISHVYSGDPRVDESAQPLSSISWEEYLSIIPEQWQPGMSCPYDIMAAKSAQQYNITVRFMHGENMQAFQNALAGNDFDGTIMGV